MVEVILHEGRNHIVRRLLAAVDHPVQRLIRTAVGPIKLGDLRPGRSRPLNRAEISELFNAVDL
jgi:23S rRNA pseudouridine2605 synthase